jgi:hypothetical protein
MTTRRRKTEQFVTVPLWWAKDAAKATRTPKALVCIHLLYAQWEAKRATFPFPANRLTRAGVSRSTRRRALCELAAAGLIIVERRHGRPPLVTINVL